MVTINYRLGRADYVRNGAVTWLGWVVVVDGVE